MKKVYSNHHAVPRSRDSKSKRTVALPKLFHASLHVVFGNLYGDEFIYFMRGLNKLLETKETVSANDLEKLRNRIKAGS